MPERTERAVPLRWRLPLSFAAVLVVVVVVIGGIGWNSARQVSFDTADARLTEATNLLTDLLGDGVTRLRDSTAAAANEPAVARFLRTATGQDAALAALNAHRPTAENHVRYELWDRARGLRLASVGRLDSLEATWSIGEPGISPFYQVDSTLGYAVTAPVVAAGDTLGWLVDRRLATSSGQGVRTIQDLIGPGTRFLVGAPGGHWTDFQGVDSGPPADRLVDGRTVDLSIPGEGARVGHGRAIPGAPWWVWVSFPAAEVYARAQASLRQVAVLSALIVLAGAFAGWAVSRSITRPLRRLAGAADAITSGDYSSRAPVQGDAELRQLARSFNDMAAEVEAGKQLLEERVARRTRELHEAQDALVRKERLAILGQLASGVGHELRNPLGVMTNAVFFLDATLKDAPPKVQEYLGILRAQVGLSEKIVSDLLDFARIKPPVRERVAMRDMVEAQLRRVTVPGGVTVERDFPPAPEYVAVDPVQVGQVIINLLTNAFQAVEGTGRVILTIRRNGGGVRLAVRDTGGGIPAEVRDKIFEPLFTTKARGIGLGLAVSRAYTESNRGRLLLEDTGPDGTTFVLELPTADSEVSA